jgi:hypothetical protein
MARARPSAAIRSAIAAAVFAVLAGGMVTASTEPRETIVALTFEGVRSADELKQSVKEAAKLEMPKLTFALPEEADGAIARALELIARQRTWGDEIVIRACGPAGQLCFVISCRRCGSGR